MGNNEAKPVREELYKNLQENKHRLIDKSCKANLNSLNSIHKFVVTPADLVAMNKYFKNLTSRSSLGVKFIDKEIFYKFCNISVSQFE